MIQMETELEEKVFMEKNLKMNFLHVLLIFLDRLLWQTLDQQPMEVNFLSIR